MASTSRDRASTSRSVWAVKDSGTSQQELTGNALPRYGSPTKKILIFSMEDFLHCDQFAHLDVHPVGLQFCIGALGNIQPHQLEFCHCLILGHASSFPQALDIVPDIQVWPYLLHNDTRNSQ